MSNAVEIKDAHRHKHVITNLMQAYLHDLSEFAADIDLADDGRFDLGDYFDVFWTEEVRHPFLIVHADRLAGFALIREYEPGAFSMSEFFILRAHRRNGVGTRAAYALFQHFPGTWRVAQDKGNTQAQAFWRRIIGEFTDSRFEDGWSDSSPEGPMQQFSSIGRDT